MFLFCSAQRGYVLKKAHWNENKKKLFFLACLRAWTMDENKHYCVYSGIVSTLKPILNINIYFIFMIQTI